MKIDLHSHTNLSDGALSPRELVMRASQMQLDVLAITDHDTLAGLDGAKASAKELYPKLQIINGVEISTAWHGFEIHVLGLNIDVDDALFNERLEGQQVARVQRSEQIAEKLKKAGVEIDFEALKASVKGVISRGHFAQAMLKQGICSAPQQAFTQYLGKGKKAYVKAKWVDMVQAVQWIHEAGGQAVLAHPFHYDMTTKWLRRLCAEFKQAGGEAMEVQHPNLAKAKHDLMIEIALEHDLMASAGSDFHAPGRWTELGKRLHMPDSITPIWHDWDL